MSQKKKILFPTDFSTFAERAVENVLHLAELMDAKLILLHAIEIPAALMSLIQGIDEEGIRKKAKEKMETYQKQLDNGKIQFETMIKVGKPWKAIVEAAKEVSPDLIIMGTQGGSGLQDAILGSNANHVIRNAPCPVLSIRNKPTHVGFNRILLPIDLRKATGEKVGWGIEFAKMFDSELVVMSVMETNEAKDINQLNHLMAKAIEHIRKQGVEKVSYDMIPQDGSVSETVVAFAEKKEVDLVCVMMQKEDGLKETVLGTNADQLANYSQVPIMSIRPVKFYPDKSYKSAHFR